MSVSKGDRSEEEVLDAIERRRRRPHVKLMDKQITLAHGAGGRSSHVLIETLFMREFSNPALDAMGDSALLQPGKGPQLAFSTDASVVSPRFFPGGDIGDLAVNGTVNDLAMAGARPMWLSASFILEEGLETAELTRVVKSMAGAAQRAEVTITTGDTKVVELGKGDGLYITTAGIGVIERDTELAPERVQAGDSVIVSGPIGDHGVAVMLGRGELEIESDLESDTAPLHELTAGLLDSSDEVRWLRDPTRGGVATVLNELAMTTQLGVILDEAALPIRDEVNGACEILGIDPLYSANEGKLVAIVGPEGVDAALGALHGHPLGSGAVVIGELREEPPAMVLLETAFGGSRVVDMLAGDPLPRIC